MSLKKLSVLALVGLLIIGFFVWDIGHYFSLAYIKNSQALFQKFYDDQPFLTLSAYFLIYVLVAGLSLPGAAVLTLASGALFGVMVGTLVVSFASSIGALAAFFMARFLLRDWLERRFKQKLALIDAGFEKDGLFYLFILRTVPLFPFFLVNVLMGLSKIKPLSFYLTSQIGMLMGTVVYVNAGTQLGSIEKLSDVLSAKVLISFVLLGIFPLLMHKILAFYQAQRVYAGWKKPRVFDRNLIVIGAGAAGLVTSYIASLVHAKVTLIEQHKMGGDCLNTGCVPSKALIHITRTIKQCRQAQALGINAGQLNINFQEIMQNVQATIGSVAPHDSIERYRGLGVEVLTGQAKITSPWHVEINTPTGQQTLTTHHIVIATGARPTIPDIPGLDKATYYTSETIWGLKQLPQRLVVLGGGPIGCELAQCFVRLGVEVTQVDVSDRLMPREDPEVSELIQASLSQEGIRILTLHQVLRCEQDQRGQHLIAEYKGQEISVEFDALLCAVGRTARTEGFGLEALNINLTDRKTIQVNDYLQTCYPNILACGDVVGPYQFTHIAAHQAWYAAINGLFGHLKRFKVDYSTIPWATFTDPEVARVGLSEQEAQERGIRVEVSRYELAELDRAIAQHSNYGFIKVLTEPGKDKILGVTIVGAQASELIAEYVLAMKNGLGLNKILSTIHIYPTLSEANKYVAGIWKKAHAPRKLLRWVGRYLHWRLG